MLLVFSFILGLVLGSFLNVCIYRLPKGESIVYPPSKCPSCGAVIKWYDNIPLISYILLKGRCRNCKERISLQYPLVELLTGFLTTGIFLKFGVSFDTLYFLFLVYALIVISFIDLKFKLVPVKVCYFLMVIGIILSPFSENITFEDSVLGASFGAGVILFIIETYFVIRGVEGMGYGDANIMALIGAYIGWEKVLLVLFISSFVGALIGISYMVFKKQGMKVAIPYGPFLSIGAYVTIIFGDSIVNWYLGR